MDRSLRILRIDPLLTKMSIRFLSRPLALLLLLSSACSFCEEPGSGLKPLEGQLENAVAAEARGEYETARKLYTQAAQDNPASGDAWAALGEHLRFYAHDSTEAATAFKRALAVRDPAPRAAAFAWRGLGELDAKEGRDDAAVDNFKRSVKAYPLADTYRSMCHLYCRQRKFKEAAEEM